MVVKKESQRDARLDNRQAVCSGGGSAEKLDQGWAVGLDILLVVDLENKQVALKVQKGAVQSARL